MLSRCSHVLGASLLVLGVVLTGCAKRPATTQAAAPAPTGAAATTPGSSAQAQPPGGGATPPSGGSSSGGTQSGGASTARPAPSEFVSIAELKDLHFDFDKYAIRPGAAKTLDTSAGRLEATPSHPGPI